MPNRLREVKPWEAVRVRPNSLVWTKKVHRPTRVVTEFHCTITPAIITFRRVRGGEEEGREERRNKELSNTTIVKNVHRYVWLFFTPYTSTHKITTAVYSTERSSVLTL